MTTLTIRTVLPRGRIFYYEPAVTTITGEVVDNPEWIADDCITLRIADAIRIIRKRDLVDPPSSLALPLPPSPPVTTTVTGSKGDSYIVTHDRDIWSCTCTGFQYRKDCRHIRTIKNDQQTEAKIAFYMAKYKGA